MSKYNYEEILKKIYSKPQLEPLKERRDYGLFGHDTVEKNVLQLLENGADIPQDLLDQLKNRLIPFPARKKASIIDFPRNNLCALVWNLKVWPPVLKQKVKKKIISDLINTLNKNFQGYKNWLDEISIVGSTTTNQYDHNADVDVNVSIDFDEFRKCNSVLSEHISDNLELRKFIRDKVYILNGQNIAGDHPVKYFVISKGRRLESDAVYDVRTDKWIKLPKLIAVAFNPDAEFINIKMCASEIIKKISLLLLKIKLGLRDLIRLEEGNEQDIATETQIQDSLARLDDIQRAIKEIHLMRFKEKDIELVGYKLSKNWEINNILFKYIEKYGFKKPSEFLKSILLKDERKKLDEIRS